MARGHPALAPASSWSPAPAATPAVPSTQTTRTSLGGTTLWRAHGQSKLANLHVALELDRRFRAAELPACIIVHPGFANTDLQARSVRETGGRAG